MKINHIQVENFRLLRSSSLDMTDGLTLVVGKNNTGKTSLVVLLERFLTKSNPSFSYSDFPVSLRARLHNVSEDTNIDELSIRLSLCVEYSDDDNLKNIIAVRLTYVKYQYVKNINSGQVVILENSFSI